MGGKTSWGKSPREGNFRGEKALGGNLSGGKSPRGRTSRGGKNWEGTQGWKLPRVKVPVTLSLYIYNFSKNLGRRNLGFIDTTYQYYLFLDYYF